MRRSLELGFVVIVILLAVIISLAVHKGSNPSEAAVLKSAPQMCVAGYGSPQCWAVSATPRQGTTQKDVSHFLSRIWNSNGAGNISVLGTYQLQRCSNPQAGSTVICTLWSTGSKDEALALEAQFVNSHLFTDITAANS
jgi:hypothetical protein